MTIRRVYLLPITVPIYVDGDRRLIATDWKRALELLRDSHGGRYGPIGVAAPWLPASEADQLLAPVDGARDAIALHPMFDARAGLAGYWLGGAQREAMRKVQALLPLVQVLHGTAEDALRPFCYRAFMAGAAADLPTVFVQDQDVVAVIEASMQRAGTKDRLKGAINARLQEHHCRRAIGVAGLTLLKGRTTLDRYRDAGTNTRAFEDTSYFSHEIVARAKVDARVASLLGTARDLRFGFCGRLVDIKGVDRSLRIVAQARAGGARVALDVIGGGPEEGALRALAMQLGLGDAVTFVGAMDYGPALLDRLAQCDALLFNPRLEETPRMIFDGYAAGLPLVAGGIAYVLERAQADEAVVALPRDDDEAAARVLVELDADRPRFAALTERACAAAQHHAADRWYEQRARWTAEMVERHTHGRRARRSAA